MTTLIQALSGGQSLGPSFVQAVGEIQSYSTWIASQSISGDQTLSTILQTVKTHASDWYNTIYPTYLNMPSTILTSGQEISGDLTMLISLAQQMQTGTSQTLEQQVQQYAKSLTATLQSLQSKTGALATALTTFQTDLTGDSGNMLGGMRYIQNQIQSVNQQLANSYGQLHSLKSAACPDKDKINACENTINLLTQRLQGYQNDGNLFQQGIAQVQNAISGAAYLASFWQGINTDIANCIQGLANIANDPPAVLLTDLQNNQKNWNNLAAILQQISQQIASPKAVNKEFSLTT